MKKISRFSITGRIVLVIAIALILNVIKIQISYNNIGLNRMDISIFWFLLPAVISLLCVFKNPKKVLPKISLGVSLALFIFVLVMCTNIYFTDMKLIYYLVMLSLTICGVILIVKGRMKERMLNK